MADGGYRFQTGAAQHFYPQFSQAHNRPTQQRPSSPLSGLIGFNPDTPSPSRSPGAQTSNYSMYGSNPHLLNGGAHRQFGGLPNLNKFQQHQNQPSPGQHHNQHQEHGSHGGAFSHHQHTHSGGGGLSNGSHFNAAHGQNGGQGNAYNAGNKTTSMHWQHQLAVAQQEREWTVPHPRARNATDASKSLIANAANISTIDGEKEERQRPGIDAASAKPKDQTWTKLDIGCQTLRMIAPALLHYAFLTELYCNNNRIRVVPRDIKSLRSLKVLDLSLNQIRSLPVEIGMLVNLKELLLVDNQLEALPYEVGNLFQCHIIALDGNPLQDDYKDIIMNKDSKTLIKTLREAAPDPEPPNDREWCILEDDPIADEDKISILNYNTLCKHYCSSALYGYSPDHALMWDHRKEVIMNELKAREPDIMCLQEVEGDSFETFFRPTLAHLDYKGMFWSKTRAKTMGHNEAKVVDGCATFYKSSKYILLDKQVVELAQAAMSRPDMKGAHDVYNRVMPKDNIAIVSFFENRLSGSRLIIVNAHLHWDHEYKDVKVVQVAVLLDQIQRLAETYKSWPPLKESEKKLFRYANGDSPSDSDASPRDEPAPKPSQSYTDALAIPLIFTGDFNSLPTSGPYELISRGELPPNHEDLENRNYGSYTKDGIKHPFHFESAYTKIDDLPFTNYVSNFQGVVDYIWYAKNTLSVRGLLGQLDPEYIERVPGFPNVHFPSDHLALMAEFGVKKRVGVPTQDRKEN